MIKSFADTRSAEIFAGFSGKGVPADVFKRIRAKLNLINAAVPIEDLRAPPANHLELLKGDRVGQHSIRVSGKWRLCLRWSEGNAYEVELVDYH